MTRIWNFTDLNQRYDLQDDLDETAMIKCLEELRPGHKCSVMLPADFYQIHLDLTGAFNIHIEAHFDDGVKWLFRLTGYPVGPAPPETRKRLIRSEAVTYQVLHEAGVPIAKLHDWGSGSFSKTGSQCYALLDESTLPSLSDQQCVHLLYDKMPGFPGTSTRSLLAMAETDDEKMMRFAEQYAAASIKISTLTLDAIGSLDRDASGKVFVGPSVDFPWYDAAGQALFGGPFRTLRDKYLFAIDNTLEAIRLGRMHRAGPLLPYLIYLDLRRLVRASRSLAQAENLFYLRHPDSTPINIMCTSDDITALVDWEGWVFPMRGNLAADRQDLHDHQSSGVRYAPMGRGIFRR